ncbi:hypothetical protein BDQ17DRAFT_1537097 [Cyathus striatus]|nr:hypothetical protein BDQ17DRAFT_1537097 [Cyathus striatus]
MTLFSCIVVGSGHAGCCAAISAIESGCSKVLVVDKCPEEWAGGNGYFTAGALRTVHGGLSDLITIVPNVASSLSSQIDIDPYTADQFLGDIERLSNGLSDRLLSKTVALQSRETIGWLKDSIGVPFTLSFNRQAYVVGGRQKFWGGMALAVENGGKGLIDAHYTKLKQVGVEMWFETKAVELLHDGHEIKGLVVERCGERIELLAPSIILAAGGFEANAEMRKVYLGSGWENARVRGTPYNTGDGFRLVKSVRGRFAGDWKGCHSTAWDANASATGGDRKLTNQFTKSGYPLGIMVNAKGSRFVDEGEDFRNYTYAKFGRAILEQPGSFAFQIWDSKVIDYLRKEEYAEEIVEKIVADNLDDLGSELAARGLEDPERLRQTIKELNDAVAKYRLEHPTREWNPAVKDGLSTQSKDGQLALPKSNWALSIDKAPFMAVKVACGITFTFGGVAIDAESAGVLSESGRS